MIRPGPDDKVYPVAKLAAIMGSLAAEGVTTEDALDGARISKSELSSPATLISLNQIIEFYRRAARLVRDPHFAFHAGQRFHVATYGMYGFAILSSTNFRETMRFAIEYHRLATPTTNISFKEQDNCGAWSIAPVPHPRVDAVLYRFLVELQFGIHLSLHRDVMGPSFVPREFHVTYEPPDDAEPYRTTFGCDVMFGQPENRIVFDAGWMDGTPQLGNEITYSSLVPMCEELLNELQLHAGLTGKVREMLLVNLARPTSFEAVAKYLAMTPRTLRRRLQEENTSYRNLIDELRMHVAVKYLRDTELTIDNVADFLGFSDSANFRHAFRRWTGKAPQEFRRWSAGPSKD
jgi:AraC-like DNA-binding protein